ncbi:type IV pilus assembly protein PilN [Desulfuromonas soudanensis]|uniref:Type IV pilus assembly protein PilN n=1 Tax=Desulfuromonas soudanensis TaxID=1603606 RepID=A0A0M4D1G8_9BACT|nr:PilN domain-containing protein [Desulfuromonas soudanensis]ALC16915.1 type IV pilus assembly protein PilN [Desulfuromonas soudanensis]
MIRINLLPVRAAQKKEQLRGQIAIAVFATVLAFAAFGAFYVMLGQKVRDEEASIAAKNAEINRLKTAIGEVAQFKKLQEELRGKLAVLDKLKEGKSGPVHLLDELSRILPEKVWLTSFKEMSGSITINGVGLNEESVAQFLRDLESSPYYVGVDLQVIEQTKQGEVNLQKFEIICNVETPVKDLSAKGGGN